jgi:hypothetical protein
MDDLDKLLEAMRAQYPDDWRPDDAQRADWAYGNAKVDNDAVTLESATQKR